MMTTITTASRTMMRTTMMKKKMMTATITLAQTAVRISKKAECLAKSPASDAGLFVCESIIELRKLKLDLELQFRCLLLGHRFQFFRLIIVELHIVQPQHRRVRLVERGYRSELDIQDSRKSFLVRQFRWSQLCRWQKKAIDHSRIDLNQKILRRFPYCRRFFARWHLVSHSRLLIVEGCDL